jgi:hypothetical protein
VISAPLMVPSAVFAGLARFCAAEINTTESIKKADKLSIFMVDDFMFWFYLG